MNNNRTFSFSQAIALAIPVLCYLTVQYAPPVAVKQFTEAAVVISLLGVILGVVSLRKGAKGYGVAAIVINSLGFSWFFLHGLKLSSGVYGN
jgi:hypothetical protein